MLHIHTEYVILLETSSSLDLLHVWCLLNKVYVQILLSPSGNWLKIAITSPIVYGKQLTLGQTKENYAYSEWFGNI